MRSLTSCVRIVSFDIRRYRSFLKLWSILVIVMGFVLLGIDLHAGLPLSWTLFEGPPTTLVGFIFLWLQPRFFAESEAEPVR